ncbi:MAG TPA: hypothetical protein VLC74_03730 [Rhizomicrobium sp.]|nr:hypothetical protein [Rhizomicrobium sp.]
MQPFVRQAGIAALPFAFVLAIGVAVGMTLPSRALAATKPLNPGQYQIGANPAIQEICLKKDGTWYGTTFNFGGYWINNPQNVDGIWAAIYGNYQVQGHEYEGYGNSTITITNPPHNHLFAADWYDWLDDFSYKTFLADYIFIKVKRDCDAPFTDENTHAATQ